MKVIRPLVIQQHQAGSQPDTCVTPDDDDAAADADDDDV